MGRIRLKTKLVLAISGMVVALVAAFSYLYVSHLVRQRTTEAYDNATFVAKQIRESARDASQADVTPPFAETNDPNANQDGSGQNFAGRPRTNDPAAIDCWLFSDHLRRSHCRCEQSRHCSYR